MTQSSQVDWSRQVEIAGWIVHRLHPFDQHDVGSVVPTEFAAYARVLHPAWLSQANDTVKVRWEQIAALTGRIVHPEVQFHMVSRPIPGDEDRPRWDGQPPREGTLPLDEVMALAAILVEHTTAPHRCWFCLWDGYGWANRGTAVVAWTSTLGEGVVVPPHHDVVPADVLAGPRVRLPHRDYLLYGGQLKAATAFSSYPWHQTPNLWWPDDRAWCVASEIDLCCTYVGGSSDLIDRIINDQRFEAVPVQLTDGITHDSDTINR